MSPLALPGNSPWLVRTIAEWASLVATQSPASQSTERRAWILSISRGAITADRIYQQSCPCWTPEISSFRTADSKTTRCPGSTHSTVALFWRTAFFRTTLPIVLITLRRPTFTGNLLLVARGQRSCSVTRPTRLYTSRGVHSSVIVPRASFATFTKIPLPLSLMLVGRVGGFWSFSVKLRRTASWPWRILTSPAIWRVLAAAFSSSRNKELETIVSLRRVWSWSATERWWWAGLRACHSGKAPRISR